MEKKSTADILLAAALIAGAAYFLFYTETGREWLERLKNTAADQLDKWLADLEDYLEELELAEQHQAAHRDQDD
jgi:phosphoserine phosphatase